MATPGITTRSARDPSQQQTGQAMVDALLDVQARMPTDETAFRSALGV